MIKEMNDNYATLAKYEEIISNDSLSLRTFFDQMDSFLCGSSMKRNDAGSTENLSIQMNMMKEMEAVRKKFEDVSLFVDKKIEVIKVECRCEVKNENKQYFKAVTEKNSKFKIIEHSLPPLEELDALFADLTQALDTFKVCLLNLECYFAVLSDIDNCCWVIDPAHPTAKDNFRRIIIGDDISAVVTINEYEAQEKPTIKLLGPCRLTRPLTERIYMYEWEPSKSTTVNLLDMLGLAHFPSAPAGLEAGPQCGQECIICLSSRDQRGELPGLVCENVNCQQHFHTNCIFQWLSTVSENIQKFKGFDTIHGKCPCCSTAMCCPTPALT